MFHRIIKNTNSKYDITWDKFRRILVLFNIILKYFFDKKICNEILFTFDDGYISQLKAARYLSRYYKVFSIIFISTDFVNSYGYITRNQIRLNKSKYIKFGSHGKTHQSLDKSIANEVIFNELFLSKKFFEDLTKKDLLYLSYPNGIYNKNTLRISREIGYKYIFTSKRASNRKKERNYTFNRFIIVRNTPLILVFVAYTGIIDFAQNFKNYFRKLKLESHFYK